MADCLHIWIQVCLFVLLMIPGWFLGKRGLLSESSSHAMGMLLTNLAMPALVLGKLLECDLKSIDIGALLICALFPFLSSTIGYLLAYWFFPKRKDIPSASSARFCSVFSNCGFLGIPLAVALFPDNPEVAVYVSVFNVVSTFLLLTLGMSLLSGEVRAWAWKKLLFTPVTVCLLLGSILLIIDCVPLNTYFASYTSYFAMLTVPLSMLILGYELSKLTLRSIFACTPLYPTTLIKLILLPLISLGCLLVMQEVFGLQIGKGLYIAIFLATGVSCAASAPAMAAQQNADASVAAKLTVGTTILCALTLPLIWMVFQAIIHL